MMLLVIVEKRNNKYHMLEQWRLKYQMRMWLINMLR